METDMTGVEAAQEQSQPEDTFQSSTPCQEFRSCHVNDSSGRQLPFFRLDLNSISGISIGNGACRTKKRSQAVLRMLPSFSLKILPREDPFKWVLRDRRLIKHLMVSQFLHKPSPHGKGTDAAVTLVSQWLIWVSMEIPLRLGVSDQVSRFSLAPA